MTERSGYSAVAGQNKARKDAKKGPVMPNESFRNTASPNKYKSAFGGKDGSQIIPPKQKVPFVRERPPLHQPKGEPQVRQKPSSPKHVPKKQQSTSPGAADKKSKSPPKYEEADDPKDLVDEQLSKIQDRIDERDPKLYVEVNIGKKGTERIVVYEGDTAESLAAEFSAKHNLKPEMKDKLITLLEQQIAGVLPKIMEDDNAEDED